MATRRLRSNSCDAFAQLRVGLLVPRSRWDVAHTERLSDCSTSCWPGGNRSIPERSATNAVTDLLAGAWAFEREIDGRVSRLTTATWRKTSSLMERSLSRVELEADRLDIAVDSL